MMARSQELPFSTNPHPGLAPESTTHPRDDQGQGAPRPCRALGVFAIALWLTAASLMSQPRIEQDDRTRARQQEAALEQLVARCGNAFCAIGAGSGVCIRPDGLIVTNEHVAGEREEWAVFFGDGRAPMIARRLGSDDRGDVFLLKVVGTPSDLPFVPLGDAAALRVGEQVMALGNPWLLSQDGRPTVTFGVVSALHYNQGAYSDAIVTDTPVNPGNSGGPLINMRGEVVGINGRIVTRFPGLRFNTGVAFAIPSSQIQNFLKTLVGDQVIWHGALHDISVFAATEPRGVGIATLYRNGPSFGAGLRYEDVITRLNGVPVTTEEQFAGLLASYPAGSRVKFQVERKKETRTVEVTLASVEEPLTGIFLDIQSNTDPVDVTLVPRIHRIAPDSPAERAGFRAGDRLTHLEGQRIETGEQFRRWIRYYYPGKKLHVAVERNGASLLLPLVLDGKPATR